MLGYTISLCRTITGGPFFLNKCKQTQIRLFKKTSSYIVCFVCLSRKGCCSKNIQFGLNVPVYAGYICMYVDYHWGVPHSEMISLVDIWFLTESAWPTLDLDLTKSKNIPHLLNLLQSCLLLLCFNKNFFCTADQPTFHSCGTFYKSYKIERDIFYIEIFQLLFLSFPLSLMHKRAERQRKKVGFVCGLQRILPATSGVE